MPALRAQESSSLRSQNFRVSAERLDSDEDREIASKAEIEIGASPSISRFTECVPRESKSFSDRFIHEWASKIFARDPLQALIDCRPGKCAFNFLPDEVEVLAKLKTPDEKKAAYWNFFKNRVARKTGLQENRTRFHIRSKDNQFEDCSANGLAQVLDDRSTKKTNFRISHVQYSSQMRPTTRLLQSAYWTESSELQCYAEALIFSDHYDDDRVEVWSLKTVDKKATLKIQVRHRIDILNTWVRRLQAKEGLAQELDRVIASQVQEAAACLTK